MFRDIDVRSHASQVATDARLQELRLAADILSAELPGDHTIAVETVDARSGRARRVTSVGRPRQRPISLLLQSIM